MGYAPFISTIQNTTFRANPLSAGNLLQHFPKNICLLSFKGNLITLLRSSFWHCTTKQFTSKTKRKSNMRQKGYAPFISTIQKPTFRQSPLSAGNMGRHVPKNLCLLSFKTNLRKTMVQLFLTLQHRRFTSNTKTKNEYEANGARPLSARSKKRPFE